MILGIDASVHQGNVPWQACYDEGVRYAFLKATEGQGYVDPMFLQHYEAAKKAGILVGAYHFYWPSRDPIQQSRHFKKTCDGLEIDLPPVLDCETMQGVGHEDYVRNLYRCMTDTERLWGKSGIFYSYTYFIREIFPREWPEKQMWASIAERDLWIAQYSKDPPVHMGNWKAWKFWQFDGDKGRKLPNGVDADYNWFAGDEEDLLKYCGKPINRPMRTLDVEVPVEIPQAQDWVLGLAEKES